MKIQQIDRKSMTIDDLNLPIYRCEVDGHGSIRGKRISKLDIATLLDDLENDKAFYFMFVDEKNESETSAAVSALPSRFEEEKKIIEMRRKKRSENDFDEDI